MYQSRLYKQEQEQQNTCLRQLIKKLLLCKANNLQLKKDLFKEVQRKIIHHRFLSTNPNLVQQKFSSLQERIQINGQLNKAQYLGQQVEKIIELGNLFEHNQDPNELYQYDFQYSILSLLYNLSQRPLDSRPFARQQTHLSPPSSDHKAQILDRGQSTPLNHQEAGCQILPCETNKKEQQHETEQSGGTGQRQSQQGKQFDIAQEIFNELQQSQGEDNEMSITIRSVSSTWSDDSIIPSDQNDQKVLNSNSDSDFENLEDDLYNNQVCSNAQLEGSICAEPDNQFNAINLVKDFASMLISEQRHNKAIQNETYTQQGREESLIFQLYNKFQPLEDVVEEQALNNYDSTYMQMKNQQHESNKQSQQVQVGQTQQWNSGHFQQTSPSAGVQARETSIISVQDNIIPPQEASLNKKLNVQRALMYSKNDSQYLSNDEQIVGTQADDTFLCRPFVSQLQVAIKLLYLLRNGPESSIEMLENGEQQIRGISSHLFKKISLHFKDMSKKYSSLKELAERVVVGQDPLMDTDKVLNFVDFSTRQVSKQQEVDNTKNFISNSVWIQEPSKSPYKGIDFKNSKYSNVSIQKATPQPQSLSKQTRNQSRIIHDQEFQKDGCMSCFRVRKLQINDDVLVTPCMAAFCTEVYHQIKDIERQIDSFLERFKKELVVEYIQKQEARQNLAGKGVEKKKGQCYTHSNSRYDDQQQVQQQAILKEDIGKKKRNKRCSDDTQFRPARPQAWPGKQTLSKPENSTGQRFKYNQDYEHTHLASKRENDRNPQDNPFVELGFEFQDFSFTNSPQENRALQAQDQGRGGHYKQQYQNTKENCNDENKKEGKLMDHINSTLNGVSNEQSAYDLQVMQSFKRNNIIDRIYGEQLLDFDQLDFTHPNNNTFTQMDIQDSNVVTNPNDLQQMLFNGEQQAQKYRQKISENGYSLKGNEFLENEVDDEEAIIECGIKQQEKLQTQMVLELQLCKLQNSQGQLLELHTECQTMLRQINLLHAIVKETLENCQGRPQETTPQLINSLVGFYKQQAVQSTPESHFKLSILMPLLSKSLGQYLNYVEEWLSNGYVSDPYGEFFICPNQDFGPQTMLKLMARDISPQKYQIQGMNMQKDLEQNVWRDQWTIRQALDGTNSTVPLIFEQMDQAILSAGKSKLLIAQMTNFENTTKKGQTHRGQSSTQVMQADQAKNTQADSQELYSGVSLQEHFFGQQRSQSSQQSTSEQDWERFLYMPIKTRIAQITTELQDFLKHSSNFTAQIGQFHSSYLISSQTFAMFTEAICEKLCKGISIKDFSQIDLQILYQQYYEDSSAHKNIEIPSPENVKLLTVEDKDNTQDKIPINQSGQQIKAQDSSISKVSGSIINQQERHGLQQNKKQDQSLQNRLYLQKSKQMMQMDKDLGYIYQISNIKLDVTPQWPVSLLINKKHKNVYNNIFQLLLQVKFATYSLKNSKQAIIKINQNRMPMLQITRHNNKFFQDPSLLDVHVQGAERAMDNQRLFERWNEVKIRFQVDVRDMQKVQLFLQKLSHATCCINTFLHEYVIQNVWKNMMDDISKAQSIDKIFQVHEEYNEQFNKMSGQGSDNLWSILLHPVKYILGVSIKLHQILKQYSFQDLNLDSYKDDIKTQTFIELDPINFGNAFHQYKDIAQLENYFTQQMNYLISILKTKYRNTGGHFEQQYLLNMLNANNYYSQG